MQREMDMASLETIPRTKKILGTAFVVDCFHLGEIKGCINYFLTHFHSDHYRGLSSSFTHGSIFCSSTTSNLAKKVLKVSAEFLKPLELNAWHEIDNCKVMLLDANHCPGACMILFHILSTGQIHLHCGDFRADQDFIGKLSSRLVELEISILNTIYLDTTYADPIYVFPRQLQVIQNACTDVADMISGRKDKQKRLMPLKWLVVTCSYMIGKERLAIGLSHILGCKVFVTALKYHLLQCIKDYGFEMDAFTNDPKETWLHMASMEVSGKKEAEEYFKAYSKKFTHMLVVSPSGWNYERQTFKWLVKEKIGLLSVPYSEHSSWDELLDCLKRTPCDFMVPTVGNYGQVLKVPREQPEQALVEWHRRCKAREEMKRNKESL